MTRRQFPRILTAILILSISALLAAPASAVQYQITRITNNGSADYFNCYQTNGNRNLNNQGQIVWVNDAGNIMFRDSDGSIQKIAVYDAPCTITLAINDAGQIAWSVATDSTVNLFYKNPNNAPQLITQFNTDSPYSFIFKLNNLGNIVWQEGDHLGYDYAIKLYDGTSIVTIGNGQYPDMNNKGQIVWSQSFYYINVYNNGATSQIACNNNALPKINDRGQIVWWGYVGNTGRPELIIYDPGSGNNQKPISNGIRLGNLGFWQINNSGQVVWSSYTYTDTDNNYNYEVYIYDSASNTTQAISQRHSSPSQPGIIDYGHVVWSSNNSSGNYDLYLSSPGNRSNPQKIDRCATNCGYCINNTGQIAYMGTSTIPYIPYDHHELYLATPQVETAKQVYGVCIGARNNQGFLKDLRGDLAALKMADQFAKCPNAKRDNIISLVGDIDTGGIQKSLIQANINYLKNKMNPGDVFFVYLTGHGASRSQEYGGDAYVQIGPMPENPTPGEIPAGALTDSELYSYLQGIDGVSKWVMIDACHSGGFWGQNCENDDGGLERLNKIGLLASATATGGADFNTLFNYGLFTYALSWAFDRDSNGYLKADSSKDNVLSFEELTAYVKYWQEAYSFVGTEVIEMAFGDRYIFSMDRWNPEGSKNGDINGIKTSGGIAPIINLLLLD